MADSDDGSAEVVDDNDNGVVANAKDLLPQADEDEDAIEIECEGKTFVIARKAKNAMSASLEANSNNLTMFFKMNCCVDAVCEILSYDKLEHLMPQTSEKIASFDWDMLIIGRPKTCPRCKRPTDPEFAKVRSVHGICKEEKDKEA